MEISNFWGNLKRIIRKLFWGKSNQEGEEQKPQNLTAIPGIGSNNCQVFYDAGYKTPESIFEASDKDLMTIPGVGIAFIKRLRDGNWVKNID